VPSLTPAEARARFGSGRVARLATVSAAGQPHVVPITFVIAGDAVYSAVDHKPKRTTALRRLANIYANPAVALIVDHYEDDWEQLWWARADGLARVLPPGSSPAISLLAARYEQYRDRPPAGPVIAVDVRRWSGWTSS